jgi:hypothetical protein
MIVRITRVKVGNRQAPQQQTETPPRKRWGFCVYASGNRTRASPLSQLTRPAIIASHRRPIRQLRYTTASTNELSEHPSLPRPHFYKLRLREEFLRELHPISRSNGQKLIVEVVTRVMQHARAGPMASIAMAAHAVPEKGITSRLG